MVKITINGEEYTIKYSMRATLESDCVKAVTKMLIDMETESDSSDNIAGLVADIAPTVHKTFYAGLVEEHGTHKYGDGKVPDKETADELLLELIDENVDNDNDYSDYFGVMHILINCMEGDGFFKRIGLERMFKTEQKPKRRRTKKTEVGEK